MKKNQWYVVLGGMVLLIMILIFGKTVNPNKKVEIVNNTTNSPKFNFDSALIKVKNGLNPKNQAKLVEFEKMIGVDDNSKKIEAFNQLASYWKDTLHVIEPYLFYTSEAAKLDNSEKTLTFAAHLLVESMLELGEPSEQNWLATQAKVLFEKALKINPNNDSSKIGLGACYILGNVSNNPMEGILPVREIVRTNPNNLYAHYILGLGGIKSNQLGKAVEHFKVLVTAQPNNVIYNLHLAECYEKMKEKDNAIDYYKKAAALLKDERIVKEIENRITELNK